MGQGIHSSNDKTGEYVYASQVAQMRSPSSRTGRAPEPGRHPESDTRVETDGDFSCFPTRATSVTASVTEPTSPARTARPEPPKDTISDTRIWIDEPKYSNAWAASGDSNASSAVSRASNTGPPNPSRNVSRAEPGTTSSNVSPEESADGGGMTHSISTGGVAISRDGAKAALASASRASTPVSTEIHGALKREGDDDEARCKTRDVDTPPQVPVRLWEH